MCVLKNDFLGKTLLPWIKINFLKHFCGCVIYVVCVRNQNSIRLYSLFPFSLQIKELSNFIEITIIL